MSTDSPVAQALGAERARQLNEGTERILRLADSAPKFTESLTHLLIPLKSTGAAAQASEIERRLNPDPNVEWNYVTFSTPQGKQFARGNPFMHRMPALGSQEWMITFNLAEQFMRLAAWWFTQMWRAAELAAGARDALDEWTILVAAACARSLLEGAAYLADELPILIELWDSFKKQGSPTIERLNNFAEDLNRRVTTLQYATRIGQAQKRPPQVLSKNVLTYMHKLAKLHNTIDVMDIYEWLCDAVHPSFGSVATYIASSLRDDARSHVVERYERHPLETLVTKSGGLHPRVAQKAADAVIFATNLLADDLAKIRWVVEDLGLTGEVASALRLDVTLAHRKPERNDQCPCGSGRKFKRCVHRWGQPGTPLGVEVTRAGHAD